MGQSHHVLCIKYQRKKLNALPPEGPQGFFSPQCGLRQGDPISPFLFIMAEEVLNRNIQKLLTYKQCSPNYYSRQASPPCHLLFADDLLIFAKATLKGARALKKISFPETPIPQALLERGPQQSEMQSSFWPCSYRSKESNQRSLWFSACFIPQKVSWGPSFSGTTKEISF